MLLLIDLWFLVSPPPIYCWLSCFCGTWLLEFFLGLAYQMLCVGEGREGRKKIKIYKTWWRRWQPFNQGTLYLARNFACNYNSSNITVNYNVVYCDSGSYGKKDFVRAIIDNVDHKFLFTPVMGSKYYIDETANSIIYDSTYIKSLKNGVSPNICLMYIMNYLFNYHLNLNWIMLLMIMYLEMDAFLMHVANIVWMDYQVLNLQVICWYMRVEIIQIYHFWLE